MESQVCVDCRTRSPETDTNYTLISARHGWRLSRRRAADGSFAMEWRCPACWQRFKEATGMVSSPDLAAERLRPHDTPHSAFARATRRLNGHNSEPPDRG